MEAPLISRNPSQTRRVPFLARYSTKRRLEHIRSLAANASTQRRTCPFWEWSKALAEASHGFGVCHTETDLRSCACSIWLWAELCSNDQVYVKASLPMPNRYGRVVTPIYKQIGDSHLDHLGSGVLVRAANSFWLLSAAHVLRDHKQGLWLCGSPKSTLVTKGRSDAQRSYREVMNLYA